MNNSRFWLDAYKGAYNGASQPFNSRTGLRPAALNPSAAMLAINPVVFALKPCVCAVQNYDRQRFVYDDVDGNISVDDMIELMTGDCGSLLWKRPTPPAANGV